MESVARVHDNARPDRVQVQCCKSCALVSKVLAVDVSPQDARPVWASCCSPLHGVSQQHAVVDVPAIGHVPHGLLDGLLDPKLMAQRHVAEELLHDLCAAGISLHESQLAIRQTQRVSVHTTTLVPDRLEEGLH